jgi:hypothetical protein
MKNTPQAVREAIAIALMVAAVTATAAALLQQPLFIPGGFVLFLIFYVWRIHPQIKAAYQEEAEEEYRKKYADDETYQPILDRFKSSHNEDAFFEEYALWKQGPHDNEVRLRFLQQAVLDLIDAKCIYRVEELLSDMEGPAATEGLEERFKAFRAQCDGRIAEIASQRLA